MKTLNIWTVMVLLMGLLVFSGSSLGWAAQDESMTNAQLTDIVVDILGIEMPANADTLSDAELFEVQANMLAERGLTLFVDASADGLVTRGTIVEVLYGALIGSSVLTTEEKIDYLASLNYISSGGADEIMGSGEIISTLNIPALSTAVAEAYSAPEGGEAGMGLYADLGGVTIPPAAANPSPEGPGSPIF